MLLRRVGRLTLLWPSHGAGWWAAYIACVPHPCVSLKCPKSLFPTCCYLSQALHAAEESVKADPTVAKSWCRLGDAYRALERWQLAHLCFTAARELSPHDPDLQVGSRVCLCLCVFQAEWQLAHLAYTAAWVVPSKDPDLQVGICVRVCLCVQETGQGSGSRHT
jgi:hypothetical protein